MPYPASPFCVLEELAKFKAVRPVNDDEDVDTEAVTLQNTASLPPGIRAGLGALTVDDVKSFVLSDCLTPEGLNVLERCTQRLMGADEWWKILVAMSTHGTDRIVANLLRSDVVTAATSDFDDYDIKHFLFNTGGLLSGLNRRQKETAREAERHKRDLDKLRGQMAELLDAFLVPQACDAFETSEADKLEERVRAALHHHAPRGADKGGRESFKRSRA